MLKLTKAAADSTPPSTKDIYLWDANLPGFGLKITPTGHRVYLIQYRMNGRKGRTRRVTLGQHGVVTTDAARKKAKALLAQVQLGEDPAAVLTLARQDITLSALCDRYLAEGCADKKASTLATDRSNISRHIKPLLGTLPIRQVERVDIERFQRNVAAGVSKADVKTRKRGRAIVTGGKGTAARAVAVLGAIFTFAQKHGLRTNNPVRGVVLFKGEKRERFLTASEFSALGKALDALEARGTSNYAAMAIRLLAMTGCRKAEVLTLQWSHVDFERSCLRLPDSKTGAKVVPLGQTAMRLFDKIKRQADCPYVFPGANGKHLVGLQKIWEGIRADAGLSDVRLHDLRHSFASMGVSDGLSLPIIGKVLGHTQVRTTQRYAHLSDDPVRLAVDGISDKVSTALNRRVRRAKAA